MRNNYYVNSYSAGQDGKLAGPYIDVSHIAQRSIMLLCPVLFLLLIFSCASAPTMEDVKRAETLNNLGVAYLNDGQINEAYTEFQKALALNPGKKETLNYLGYISTRFKKYDEAISYYKKAISLDPNYADAVHNLGVTYADMGSWDEAIKYFKAALSNPVYSTPGQAYSNLGYAYYKKGDFVNAEKSLKDALIRNPVYPSAMYILGLVYIETNREQSAIEEFKKAIGILPEYADAHWELAKVYLKTGQKARALKHFEVVAEKDTDTARRREALVHIEQLKY
ncbi:MAG: tetratricopeptide repeat protein [Nitrospirae bacterium]|nr:tetratricopeptide repeat protein [Nitrospirota bacterium]